MKLFIVIEQGEHEKGVVTVTPFFDVFKAREWTIPRTQKHGLDSTNFEVDNTTNFGWRYFVECPDGYSLCITEHEVDSMDVEAALCTEVNERSEP